MYGGWRGEKRDEAAVARRGKWSSQVYASDPTSTIYIIVMFDFHDSSNVFVLP